MNTSTRKTRIGAIAILGLCLFSGAISAQAASPSQPAGHTPNPQRTVSQHGETFDVNNAFAYRGPSEGAARLSDDLHVPARRVPSSTIESSSGERSNSASVIKYQSPYMSAPY